MKKLSDDFITAARDYRALLEKKYPPKAVFNLVATRYALNAIERSVLFRGISTGETASARRSRITKRPADDLYIDGFNVVITIASYLAGNFVYLSLDSMLRDTSEVNRSSLSPALLSRAASLVSTYLRSAGPARVVIYIDKPVDGSELLSGYFKSPAGDGSEALSGYFKSPAGDGVFKQGSRDGNFLQDDRDRVLRIDTFLVPSADHELKILDKGTIATSDSQIIDKGRAPVFDLARHTLEGMFDATFISLAEMLEGESQVLK